MKNPSCRLKPCTDTYQSIVRRFDQKMRKLGQNRCVQGVAGKIVGLHLTEEEGNELKKFAKKRTKNLHS